MRYLSILLATLFLAAPVLAAESPAPHATDQQVKAVKEKAKTTHHTHKKHHRHTRHRYPRGDLRHCLELKGDEAIIRCAEGK
jgi:Ni/Co efflux regulator RcnB